MLRVVEHYASVQGEGPRVGTLTQFVRFAGCNMRCPGWPCDTQHAIDPAIWRTNSEKIEPWGLNKRITEMAQETGAYNICLTGGEPFMQDSVNLFDALNPLAHPSKRYTFECFTNGSFSFPRWTKNPLMEMLFMMDWKLPGSGEGLTSLDQRRKNVPWLDFNDGIKFVVKDGNDLLSALGQSVFIRQSLGFKGYFYVGTAWDQMKESDLVDFMMENRVDWKLNVQVHKYIYDPNAIGV